MNLVVDSPTPKTDLSLGILQQLEKITETGNKFRDQILELGEKLKSLQKAEGQDNEKFENQSMNISADWLKPAEINLKNTAKAQQKMSNDLRELEKRRLNLQELVAGKIDDVLKDVAMLKSLTETIQELKPKLEKERKITRDLESQVEQINQDLSGKLELLKSATTSNQNALKSSLEKFRVPSSTKPTESDGWIVIQRRDSGPRDDLERDWMEYENGFGSVDGNFWLGLKKIHELTADGSKELQVELTDWDESFAHAYYSKFSVGNAAGLYRLSIGGYSGNAGDSLKYHDGGQFSTHDKKTNENEELQGGWWKNDIWTNLNGLYYDEEEAKAKEVHDYGGAYWWTWKEADHSLQKILMKIRPRK